MRLSTKGPLTPISKKQTRFLTLLCTTSMVVLPSFLCLPRFAEFQDSRRAKRSRVQVRTLANILELEKPPSISPEIVRELLGQYDRAGYEIDAWGNPLEVSVLPSETGEPKYRVISLGRDGQADTSFKRFVAGEWDRDAVMEAGEWIQVW